MYSIMQHFLALVSAVVFLALFRVPDIMGATFGVLAVNVMVAGCGAAFGYWVFSDREDTP